MSDLVSAPALLKQVKAIGRTVGHRDVEVFHFFQTQYRLEALAAGLWIDVGAADEVTAHGVQPPLRFDPALEVARMLLAVMVAVARPPPAVGPLLH